MLKKLFALTAGAVFLFICFATLSPIEMRPETDHVAFERFGAFALLGLLTALASPRRPMGVAVLIVTCALGLEALQLVVPTRHAQIADALVKVAGGICGVALAQLAVWMHGRKQTGSAGAI